MFESGELGCVSAIVKGKAHGAKSINCSWNSSGPQWNDSDNASTVPPMAKVAVKKIETQQKRFATQKTKNVLQMKNTSTTNLRVKSKGKLWHDFNWSLHWKINGLWPLQWMEQKQWDNMTAALSVAPRGALKKSGAELDLNGKNFEVVPPIKNWEPHPIAFKKEASTVRSEFLKKALQKHPNKAFRDYVGDMVENGARVRARGPPFDEAMIRKNLSSGNRYSSRVLKYLRKEVEEKRMEFTGNKLPHCRAQIWPIGVIEKKGKLIHLGGRCITHYSFNGAFGGEHQRSLNDMIGDEDSKIVYTRIIDTLDDINWFKQGGDEPAMAALDVANAFRNCLIHEQDLHLHCYQFPNEEGKMEFYVDRCLGFGGASSPAIFGQLANAIQYIAEERIKIRHPDCEYRMKHLADDYIVVGKDFQHTHQAFNCLLSTLEDMGIPTAPDKTEPPTTKLCYLGIDIDITNTTVSLPEDKRKRMVADMEKILSAEQWKTKDMERIVGKLNFAHVCYPESFPLVAGFYKQMCPASRKGQVHFSPSVMNVKNMKKLKQIISNNPTNNFSAFAATPTNAQATFAVDAAGRDGVGGFGLDGQGWNHSFHLEWPLGWNQDDDEFWSSQLQELVGMFLVVVQHSPTFNRINIFTDSLPATQALHKGFSTKEEPNRIIFNILQQCQENNCTLCVMWRERDKCSSARAADLLSRGLLAQAQKLIPQISVDGFHKLSPNDFQIFTRK